MIVLGTESTAEVTEAVTTRLVIGLDSRCGLRCRRSGRGRYR